MKSAVYIVLPTTNIKAGTGFQGLQKNYRKSEFDTERNRCDGRNDYNWHMSRIYSKENFVTRASVIEVKKWIIKERKSVKPLSDY
ncbi:hypothetical protein MIDIC_170014 [Alphaproteobacteria bacterium]